MSSCIPDLTTSEAYALWGERIRCLFADPPSFVEAAVAHNPYERHTCAVPISTSPYKNESPNLSTGSSLNPADPTVTTGASSYFYDEALYPFCFYTRLLQTTEKTSSSAFPLLHKFSVRKDAESGPVLETQRLRIDEDELAAHLALRLRARNREQISQLQQQHNFASGQAVPSFCDPKLEEQVAALHNELTEFLLEVREKNKASVALRYQLQRSRLVRERLPDAAFLPSNQSPRETSL